MEEISSHNSKSNYKSLDLKIKAMKTDAPFQENNNNKNTIFKSVNVNDFKEEKNDNNNNNLIISDTSSSFFQKDNNSQTIVEINSNTQKKNTSFIDEASIISKTSSHYNRAMNIINIRRDGDENNEEIKETNKHCLICYEELTFEELQNNFIGCFHGFCDDCLYNYFKEKINNNKVDNIKCPQHDCDQRIFDNFIEMKISNDANLLQKFIKFTNRRKLMNDPTVKLCPFPDCQSYAYQKENTNNVTCVENKHKFCFNCLKDWHENEECNIDVEKSFENWRDSTKVKRCPRCKQIFYRKK